MLNKGNRSRQRQQGHAHIYVCMHINSNIHMKVLTFEINDLLPKLLLHHIHDKHYPSDSPWIIKNPNPTPKLHSKKTHAKKKSHLQSLLCEEGLAS